MVRIDSWHTTTPHQIQQMTYMYSCNNVPHSSDFIFVFVFFYGEEGMSVKKKSERVTFYIAATDDPVRFKGDGGGWRFITEVKGSESVVQSSSMTRANTVHWLQDEMVPDKLLFDIIGLCSQLFVCFRYALIIYMYFGYLNLFICA